MNCLLIGNEYAISNFYRRNIFSSSSCKLLSFIEMGEVMLLWSMHKTTWTYILNLIYCVHCVHKKAMCTLAIQLYKWQVKWRGKWKLKTHLCDSWSVCYTWFHPTHTATWCSSKCEPFFYLFLYAFFVSVYQFHSSQIKSLICQTQLFH